MIRCDLSIDQSDALLRSPPSITRLIAVFAPQAQTPMRIGQGWLTPSALCDLVNNGDISEEALQEQQQEAEHVFSLRRAAARAREHSRAQRHAMEDIRAAATPDTPAAHQLKAWIDARRVADATLRDLLQSPLEDRLRDNPGEVEETLSKLFSNLAFPSAGSAEQHRMDGAALRA